MRTQVALVLAVQLALCVSIAHCADEGTPRSNGPLPLDRLRQMFGGGSSDEESAETPAPRTTAPRTTARSRSATARPQMSNHRSTPRTASRTPRPGIFSRPSQTSRQPAVEEVENEATTAEATADATAESENDTEPALAASEETASAPARAPIAPTVTLARQTASLNTNAAAQPVSAASYDSVIRAAPRPVTPREVATPRSQSRVVRSHIPVETKPVPQSAQEAAPQASLVSAAPSQPLSTASIDIEPADAPATQTVIPSRLLASEASPAAQPFEVGLSPSPTLIPAAPTAPATPAADDVVTTTPPAQPETQTRVTTIPRNTRPVIVPAAPRAMLPADTTPPPQTVVQTPIVQQPIVQQPIVQQPIVEQLIVEQPIVEQPIVEQPVVQQPLVQQPIVQQPIVQQPIVQAAPQPTSDNVYVQPNGGVATVVPANTGTALNRVPTERPVAIARLTANMVGPQQIFFGDTGIFKVMLVNEGDAPARDVRVEVLANDALVKTLNVGTIPAKSDIEVEIALAPNKTGPMELRASATGSDGVKAVAGSAVFVGKPELSLAIAGPPQMNFGDLKLYTAILNNSGNADATNVSVLVMLQGEQAQSLPVGIVPAGQSRQVRFELRPNQAGQVSVNAVASADGNVQAVANGAIHVMKHEVELAFDGPRQMKFGEKAIYTLTVRNQGNSDAENLVVNVTLGESVLDRLWEGDLAAGKEEKISFEVSPSKPGFHALRAAAVGAGNIQAAASAKLQVQHGQLEVKVESPSVKFAGAEATYTVRVKNIGDANAEDVLVTAHLPESVKFLGGIDRIDFYEGITWRIGHMTPGQEEKFELRCELSAAGEQKIVINATGADQLEASQSVTTAVEALADVRLFVADPQGLVPVGQDVVYEIEVHNRGVKPAENIEVVMQLSDSLEPIHVEGAEAQRGARGVVFDRIPVIAAKETIKLRVTARAKEKGSHQYRVEMTAEEPNTFMASEGTTRFYGTSSVGEAAADARE